jgi:hypothetical protein
MEQEAKPIPLAELLPEDIFIGTSLILGESSVGHGGRFLYGIRPEKTESEQVVLEITGIGGGLEEDDPTIGAGAIREAQEEIACAVTLLPSPETLLIKGEEQISLTKVAGPEKPLAIIYRNHRTPPRYPWHPVNEGRACLVLFLAELRGRPRPEKELPNLIWLTPELVLETVRRHVPLGELLMAGAALVPGRSGAPPLDQLTRMTDSQEALAIALGDLTPDYYKTVYSKTLPDRIQQLVKERQSNQAAAELRKSQKDKELLQKHEDVSHMLVDGDVLVPDEDQGVKASNTSASIDGIKLEASGAILNETRKEIQEINQRLKVLMQLTDDLREEVRQLKNQKSSNPLHWLIRKLQRRQRSDYG